MLIVEHWKVVPLPQTSARTQSASDARDTRRLNKGNVHRFFDPPTRVKTLKHFFVTTMNRLTVNSPSSRDPMANYVPCTIVSRKYASPFATLALVQSTGGGYTWDATFLS